jgi:hypothetical protein
VPTAPMTPGWSMFRQQEYRGNRLEPKSSI